MHLQQSLSMLVISITNIFAGRSVDGDLILFSYVISDVGDISKKYLVMSVMCNL